MDILLKKEDYIRTLIVSNKINRRHLNEEGLEKLKVEFFLRMIEYYLHEEKFIDVAKSYKVLYDFLKQIKKKINRYSRWLWLFSLYCKLDVCIIILINLF